MADRCRVSALNVGIRSLAMASLEGGENVHLIKLG